MRTVLIVEERPVFRLGIRESLTELDPDSKVSYEAVSIAEAACCMDSDAAWQALVIGIARPADTGMRLLRLVRQRTAALPVLALISMPERVYGLRLLRLGATGVISDRCRPETLLRAVRRTLAGRRYLSPALTDQLITQLVEQGAKQGEEVCLRQVAASPEQLEVIRLIAQGKDPIQIGQVLSLPTAQVDAHRRDVLHRARLANDHELTYYAYAEALVPDRRKNRQLSGDA